MAVVGDIVVAERIEGGWNVVTALEGRDVVAASAGTDILDCGHIMLCS